MASVYSVGQVNSYIRNMFSQDFALRRIYVRGEVSNCTYHRTGHIYFSLKDESGILSCIMFYSKRQAGLKFPLKDGQKVVVLGAVEVYEKGGSYSLHADAIRLDGVGDLYQLFLEQKKRLEAEGLFSKEAKKPIPHYVQHLGVVTAPTGAAVRDIIQIATRRNPHIEIILCPALVQGEHAAESIARGIELLDSLGLDCLIVGRGGGSMEDLWAFNEEVVARAIFDCETPVISAVGHETDWTIADYVADLRAPTPSAASELAVFDYTQVAADLDSYAETMDRILQRRVRMKYLELEALEHKLAGRHPLAKLNRKKEELERSADRLADRMQRILRAKEHTLALLAGRLEGNSPLKRLSPGYAYVEMGGEPLLSAAAAKEGDLIRLRLHDGSLTAQVTEKKTDGPAGQVGEKEA